MQFRSEFSKLRVDSFTPKFIFAVCFTYVIVQTDSTSVIQAHWMLSNGQNTELKPLLSIYSRILLQLSAWIAFEASISCMCIDIDIAKWPNIWNNNNINYDWWSSNFKENLLLLWYPKSMSMNISLRYNLLYRQNFSFLYLMCYNNYIALLFYSSTLCINLSQLSHEFYNFNRNRWCDNLL